MLRASYRHQGLPATPRSSERGKEQISPTSSRRPNPTNTQNPSFQAPDCRQQFPLSKGSMVLHMTTPENPPCRGRCRHKGPRRGAPSPLWTGKVKVKMKVTQSCPTLCGPMDCSTPGPPVYHQLPEFTQTNVCQVSDAIQPSHPLKPPSPTFNFSQH